ncbi:mannose-1-phosphate guanylyltransferase/mannose-6-phosphate isomerase [Jannaschia marina]|uniref:mannose-1-phosphate guanylyltransferase/mannose-6-phosphate isomerase n=1 Tax=Jannaschia marina TaxID=2741674 RepID=UPI0015CD22EB|nr:mannose-1-phosphate guanylyltransferase/mannose-6-phosphate isomerase [Jannaschia marina]
MDGQTPTITPVILCGGSGTRLWPLSRRSYPKQFSTLVGEGSLFQQTALRLTGPGFAPPVTVTNEAFRFIVSQQLAEVGVSPGAMLLEPEPRNTAPAILAATLRAAQLDPDAVILAAPADHFIPDGDGFRAAMQAAIPAAQEGEIVTFGIQPDRPETGYGYLRPGTGSTPVTFIEKPDRASADALLAEGGVLWNAGIFLFTVQTLIAAFARHAPDTLAHVRDAIGRARPDLGFLRLDAGPWAACTDLSIDFAIMEKADNLTVVPYDGEWSDLGGWEAVHRHTSTDADANAQHGPALAVACRETLLRAENGGQQIVGLGLDNIVAVAMPDAVLIADRAHAEEIGTVVKTLRAEGVPQADTFPKDHRPWGFFEPLILGERFQVKRIVVNPGAALSLQSHVHRAEHWVVVAGTARVTIGETERLVGENQSVFIPLGEMHQLENPGKMPMELIEVQTGAYLGEDDITRYDDPYAR